jgi:hypothetical protein
MTHTPGPWKVRPTSRRTSEPDMFDIIANAPDGGTYIVAKYVREDDARLIVELVNDAIARAGEVSDE